MNSLNFTFWQDSLKNSAEVLWTKLAEYVPNIIGTILLLMVGYIVSKMLSSVSIKVLKTIGIDKISEKIGFHEGLEKVGIRLKVSDLFGKVFFWLIMLTFVISASEALNLEKVTITIDTFVRYLPNIVGAGFIFVLGLMIAHFLRSLIESSTQKISLEYGKTLATVVHSIAVVVVSILAIDQLQLETELLSQIIEIILMSAGVALALSFGIGTKDLSKNIISGIYIKEQLKPGSNIEFNDINGNVKQVGTVNTTVELSDGKKVHIPNSALTENIIKSK